MKKTFTFFILITFCSLAFANMNPNIDLQTGQLRCPFNPSFQIVKVQPIEDGQYLIQCKNATGSSYFSSIGVFSYDMTDPSWVAQPYPSTTLCLGGNPEECEFTKG